MENGQNHLTTNTINSDIRVFVLDPSRQILLPPGPCRVSPNLHTHTHIHIHTHTYTYTRKSCSCPFCMRAHAQKINENSLMHENALTVKEFYSIIDLIILK